MTAEVNRGETVVWKAGNSELRCKLGIIGDVVLVLKAIVPYRELIQVAARRKRITDDRVGVRSQTSHWIDLPGGYSTSGCRIVDFVLKYGPTQRVGANLRLNPGLSVA